MADINFKVKECLAAVSVDNTAGQHADFTLTQTGVDDKDAFLCNNGAATVYVKFGDSTVLAATSGAGVIPVSPGAQFVTTKGSASRAAYKTSSGTCAEFIIASGQGN